MFTKAKNVSRKQNKCLRSPILKSVLKINIYEGQIHFAQRKKMFLKGKTGRTGASKIVSRLGFTCIGIVSARECVDNCCMRRFFCFLTAFLFSAVLCAPLFSLDRRVRLTLGLGTGYVFYGDSDVETSLSGSSRAVATTDALLHIPLAHRLDFLTGMDCTGDFVVSGSEHFIRYDYAFLGGLEVHTPLEGLSFSVSYALGRRTDFIALKDSDGDLHKWNGSTKWGNGFKFSLDYDFGAITGGWAPTIGASWRNMPRGGSRDNGK